MRFIRYWYFKLTGQRRRAGAIQAGVTRRENRERALTQPIVESAKDVS